MGSMGKYFRLFILGLVAFQIAVASPVAWGAGSCRKETSLSEQLRSWSSGPRRLFRQQLDRVQGWNQAHIGWTKSFDSTSFKVHRRRYIGRLQSLYPNGESSTNTAAAGSFLKLPKDAKAEQKLAFLEAVGSHFISPATANPLRAENILDTRVRDFLKKRRFFKKLNSLKFNNLKLSELEGLLVDLYTVQNPGKNGLPSKIKALVSSVLPLKGDFYQAWYRDAVVKRFFIATLREGILPAMAKMNMKVKEPLLSEIRRHQPFRQLLGAGVSAALNWYVLLPMAYMFGYIHLPNVKLADWLPITRALKAEMENNPEIIKEIVASGFNHKMVDHWACGQGNSGSL